MQAGLDRTQGHIERQCDLIERHVLDESQQQRLPLLDRQSRDEFSQIFILPVPGPRQRIERCLGRNGKSSRFAQYRDRIVLRDWVEKRGKLAAVFDACPGWRKSAQQIDEGLLQHVEGKVLISHNPQSDPQHEFLVATIQLFKRGLRMGGAAVVAGPNEVGITPILPFHSADTTLAC